MRHGPTEKILVISVDISVLEQRGHCCSAALCCPISWHSRRCPRVAHSSGSAETQAATQEETEFIRLLWLEIVQGGNDDTIIDQEIS